ncbi:GH11032 [Drosophila grimshawi]|uniref:GH11032 n=1 Tax=Drosophila grimshawi TaxID=7222 RepID=B4JC43_DROGR|nr:GH11032 [Drosophila grimshawi]
MEQRANFLALTLLDALEDENESDIFSMLDRNNINAGIVPCERGLSPLHYVCGMQNEELALRILQRFLTTSGGQMVDVNVRCEGEMTALHIAANYGRVELVRLLLAHGARPDLMDEEHKLAVHYAIEECHFEVLQLMRDHIFKEKQQEKQKPQQQEQQSLLTPQTGIKYNQDVTSPYYINITHRRGKPQPRFPDVEDLEPEQEQSVNLFALTRDHLHELNQETGCGRRTLIESWRDKVERSRARKSLLQVECVESLVDQAMSQENFSYEHHLQQTLRDTELEEELLEQQLPAVGDAQSGRAAFGQLVEQVAQACVLEQSFHTAHNGEEEEQEQPSPDKAYYLQMTEAYVHTDDENGLVFYETKLPQNATKKQPMQYLTVPKEQGMDSSVSTNLTLPLDYETDALRAELTQLGAPVGPITHTTKRLYIKQLIKYKRNTAALLAAQKHAKAAQVKYSVELHHTLRTQQDYEHIERFMQHEVNSATHFATACAGGRRMREGHLKQSFIYMLIDPRISRNLPGERAYLDPLSIWSRFLDAIFYVGKGKSSRPYAHLYDAMRQHTRANQQHHEQHKKRGKRRVLLMPELFKSPPAAGQAPAGSKKLQRILDIWQHGSGVVCLHVFHNILPTDAYTREASIIDALGLAHLTNLKRGDYYGPAQIWTMKQKKQLGIALLYKAMHIYMAEGESQLSPSDLI